MIELLSACVLLFLAFVLGVTGWTALFPHRNRSPIAPCLAFGIGVVMLIHTVIAAVGGGSAVMWLGTGSASILAIVYFAILKQRPRLEKFEPQKGPIPIGILCASGVMLLLMAIVVIRPLFDYDLLSYHVPLSRHLAAGGGLAYLESNYYSRLPLGVFALYAPITKESSFDSPEVFAHGIRAVLYVATIASALLAVRIAGQLGGRRSLQLLAGLVVFVHPEVWKCVLYAHNDLLVLLFGLAATERLFSASATRSPASFFLVGFLSGSAAAIKFSALPIITVPVVLMSFVFIAINGIQKKDGKQSAIGGAMLLLGLALSLGPWLLRSFLLSGSLLYPFSSVDLPGFGADQALFVVEQHDRISPFSSEYWTEFVSNFGLLGPALPGILIGALFGLSILALFVSRKSSHLVIFLLAGMGYCAWLIVAAAPTRFALFPIIAATIFGVSAIRRLVRVGRRELAVLGLAILVQGAAFKFIRSYYLLPLSGDQFSLAGQLPSSVRESAWLLAAEGEEGLLLFEARSAAFPESTMASTVWDQLPWKEELQASENAEQFAQALGESGIGWVFINEFELSRLINFYGDLEAPPAFGTVGIGMPKKNLSDLLSHYPPARFSGLDEHDLDVLIEFLLLTRARASTSIQAGQVSQIWVTRLDDLE